MMIKLKPSNTSYKLAVLVVAAFSISACSPVNQPRSSKTDYAALKANYKNEPYEVLLVDRAKFDRRFMPTVINAPANEPTGTIIVNTTEKFLYLIQDDGKALRYGIAVGAAGHAWHGKATIARKAKWPTWYPTDNMRQQTPDLPRSIEPGTHNPLGARALYLYQGNRDTLYRIHGTSEPWTIGTDASSGCIRMLNEDAIDLYDRAKTGATVIVL